MRYFEREEEKRRREGAGLPPKEEKPLSEQWVILGVKLLEVLFGAATKN
jgi:hypothetical protein